MNNLILKLLIKFKDLGQRDEGQDLVEYALVVALIAFGATAGMGGSGRRNQQRVQHYQHNPLRQHHLVAARASAEEHALGSSTLLKERFVRQALLREVSSLRAIAKPVSGRANATA